MNKQFPWLFKSCSKSYFTAFIILLIGLLFPVSCSFAQDFMPGKRAPYKYRVDRRIDNMGYWKRMAELGLVPVAPARKTPPAIKRSSLISNATLATYDSPDIPVTLLNSTQSENSIFISPSDRFTVLNSNNGSLNPYPGYFFGADDFFSEDGGESWDGQIHGAGGNNMGDPSTAINSNGRWFVGYIYGGGQAISYSNDDGATWKIRAIASAPPLAGGMLDKSHLWIDNSDNSDYKGNLYDGWTVISGPMDGVIQIARSTDNGLAWQQPVRISDSVHAKSHNQGVNIATGPNGEVYAVWSVYDAFPGDENALGFASSFNGGQSWHQARRIIDNIRGIRLHGVTKTMRTNSFPSMAVDNSNSPWRGSIYIVWANVNKPGINTGIGVDVYLIRSADSGNTWSPPIRINQDLPLPDKQHFFPWITCDPANGDLAVVFYDDRNTSPNQLETWVATSTDGGNNWQDFRISDVAFTPYPITGLSDEYFGDYLGIAAREGVVYPSWTDNRSGVAMTYVSPFRLGPAPGEPYVAFRSESYNDSVTGNANGIPEYGEAALLDLSLRNMGDLPDTNVMVTLSSDSPFVHFTDSLGFIPQIGVEQTVTLEKEFAFKISDVIPNGTEILFTVTATDIHDSTFRSSFSLNVQAPEVLITDFFVNDSASNNNHSLDPGETAFVKIRLKNPTSYLATNVVCRLVSPQAFIHLPDTVMNLGEITPGITKDAVFGIRVDSVTAGVLASFNSGVDYSGLHTGRQFLKKIGLIFEDWETGNFKKFNWTFGGNLGWTVDSIYPFEGKYCARSGAIANEQTSSFSLNCRALTNDSISFYRKVSSESRFDFLNFYIDEARVGQWSGDMDWERVVYPLLPGIHNLKWEYTKDLDVISGIDATFVDFIEFPSIQFTTADAGPDASIFDCQDYFCSGAAFYYDSLEWTSTGSGYFSDPSNEQTLYKPSKADKEAGFVLLILTAYGSSENDVVSDTLSLVIVPGPTANAGIDAGICKNEDFQLSEASATNYNSITWSTTGDGVFSDPFIMHPMYYPGTEDTTAGNVKLILSSYASNVENCGLASDTINLSFYPLPVIPLIAEYQRCTGYSATLDAVTDGGTHYVWKPTNEITPQITVDSTGIGVGQKLYTVEVTGKFGCTSIASCKVIFHECAEKKQVGNSFFRVFPNPSRDDFYVEIYSPVMQNIAYQLANAAGSLISSGDLNLIGQKSIHLNLFHLPAGSYIITIKADNTSASQKIVLF